MKTMIRAVRDKFGSVRNFAKASGLNYSEALNAINRNDPGIMEIALKTRPLSVYITKKDRKKLRKRIIQGWGSVRIFAEDNGFSYVTVMQILDGRRKRKSKLVKQIFEKSHG